MFANLKLKSKMLIGYAIPTVIFLGISGLVYSTASQVSQTFQDVARVQTVISNFYAIDVGANVMVRSFRGYLAAEKPEFLQEYADSLKTVRALAKETEPLIVLPEQKERLKRVLELSIIYDQGNDETKGSDFMIRLIRQGKKAEAIALFKNSQLPKVVKEIDEVTLAMEEVEQKLLVKETDQARAAMNTLLTALILGSILLIILATCIALVISSSVARTITQAVNAISTSSTEIAVTVEQHERTTTQQAAAVNQTTTTMDELSASSRQSAEQAETAANGAKQVLSLVDGHTLQAGYSGSNGSSLREKVGQITDQILHLSEQTGQIGIISTLVSDLANQTNMLALNAAVEAVRAGEHGKGFGVVAAEIRKLADQSKKSAERINALVVDIKNATNSTVMVTDEGSKTVETIVTAVNEIALTSQQISLTAKQQAIAIQQVGDAMNALNQSAVQTALGINQTKVGTQKLNEAALNLKAIV
ncbi:CHASE3 domain-containing protein [Phormidium sp. CLA17]|uniref:methyl-accepting chemotaxis protein n=1 Tax=Leptolyngbya sp. Cla-17 TaxID=2803751 RepID=UPI001491F59B|nr:methyl-accepting chemotaxis protein [Leptolyngbya sp. Cla-17]MBM0744619.1 CHASE3 domain-containing protein [Leptolyngbya sp. Cla-17]